MKALDIKARIPYRLHIGQNLLMCDELLQLCHKMRRHIVIITDEIVAQYWGNTLLKHLNAHLPRVSLLSFPAGETHKTRETKAFLEDRLFELGCGRDTCMVALGGGVVLDMAGFLAATYCRGVPVIYLPTTLLAMVDASLGGKTGVNTPFGKNLIGTISSPHSVWIDVSTLKTLPESEWRNGFAEMVKHALLRDESLFHALCDFKYEINEPLCDKIATNLAVKKEIVEQDETELGLREVLNLGHTIGHAIERIENYGISHGEAVAMGLLVESYISVRLGLLQESDLSCLMSLLKKFGFLLKTTAFEPISRFMAVLTLDKKSRAKVPRFVLLERIGCPYQKNGSYAHPVDEQILLEALKWAEVNLK
jgi:3-dehydroquinate synthase